VTALTDYLPVSWVAVGHGRRKTSVPVPQSGMETDVRGVVDNETHPRTPIEARIEMTGLGAAIYGGFFALAALWLFMTSDYRGSGARDQVQRPDRSNSTNNAADADGSSPWVYSHSSSK